MPSIRGTLPSVSPQLGFYRYKLASSQLLLAVTAVIGCFCYQFDFYIQDETLLLDGSDGINSDLRQNLNGLNPARVPF